MPCQELRPRAVAPRLIRPTRLVARTGLGWQRRETRPPRVPFGVALPVRLALVLKGPEQAAPTKVSLHAPDQALQHLAHFAGPKVPEPFPGELAVLAPCAIEGDHVEGYVEMTGYAASMGVF